jgi:GT2 family glycosyltransferase
MNGIPPVGGTAVVVLNYRTPHKTIRAVHSVQESQTPASAIIVVDNASGDGSLDVLRELRGVEILPAAQHHGFSAGCNLGIERALALGAERILLLNSDAVVAPEMLTRLEGALTADPRLGIVGPMVVAMSDPEVIETTGMMYSNRTGRMRHYDAWKRRSECSAFDRRIVDGVTGCAMLIRREVVERIGGLAEPYFFGFEDLDLCLRATSVGLLTASVGTAVVLHEGNASIGRRSARRVYFAVRNHLLLAHRFRQPRGWMAASFQTGAILAFNLAYVLVRAEVPRREGLSALIAGVRDYVAGRSGSGRFE